jgi:hypothetical protein
VCVFCHVACTNARIYPKVTDKYPMSSHSHTAQYMQQYIWLVFWVRVSVGDGLSSGLVPYCYLTTRYQHQNFDWNETIILFGKVERAAYEASQRAPVRTEGNQKPLFKTSKPILISGSCQLCVKLVTA